MDRQWTDGRIVAQQTMHVWWRDDGCKQQLNRRRMDKQIDVSNEASVRLSLSDWLTFYSIGKEYTVKRTCRYPSLTFEATCWFRPENWAPWGGAGPRVTLNKGVSVDARLTRPGSQNTIPATTQREPFPLFALFAQAASGCRRHGLLQRAHVLGHRCWMEVKHAIDWLSWTTEKLIASTVTSTLLNNCVRHSSLLKSGIHFVASTAYECIFCVYTVLWVFFWFCLKYHGNVAHCVVQICIETTQLLMRTWFFKIYILKLIAWYEFE